VSPFVEAESGSDLAVSPSSRNGARQKKGKVMRFRLLVLALIVATSAAFACKKTEEATTGTAQTATAATTSEISGTASPNDLNPIKAQSYVDDVTIGHEVGADGTIPTGKTGDNFVSGQKIYIAMKVKDAPPNTAVKVVYNGPPDNTKVGEETKNVPAGATFMVFEKDTKGWKKGDYAADVFVGDEKVNTQHFNVVDAKAGQK
jgi:hypothetical protein